MATRIPSDSPSEQSSSNPLMEGTILFDENDQAIDHVLSNVLQLTNREVRQIKLWLASYNITSLSMLLELFRACPEKVKVPTYKNGAIILHLSKHLSVTLAMICKVAEYICTPENREMVNKDWLNLTRQAYEEAKLNLILSKPSKVGCKQYPPSSFPLPDWYPRSAIEPVHAVTTCDKALFRTKEHTKMEDKVESICAETQDSLNSSCKFVDSSSFSASHTDPATSILRNPSVDSSYDPDKKWPFRAITAHQGPLPPTDPDYKGSRYNVYIEWETGEVTIEPLSIFAQDAPLDCAMYAEKHGLTDEPGWKHLRRFWKTKQYHDRIPIGDDFATTPTHTSSTLANRLHAMIASEHRRTHERLQSIRRSNSVTKNHNQDLHLLHHCVYPSVDKVPTQDKGEPTCDATKLTEETDIVCDLDQSHHSLLDSPSICEYSNSVIDDNLIPVIEHICDTAKHANSPSKSTDATGNGEQEHDQSINEALKVIELSLNKVHQSLMIIKGKNVDPATMTVIMQQARELQVLVTANSSASTISSITTLSGDYYNHDFMYEPCGTGDPHMMFIPTPTPKNDEPTVVSLESKGITHKENPSENESVSWQASLPDFNGMYFVPTDEGPPDPQSHLLEKDKGPLDPMFHAIEYKVQVPPDPTLMECNPKHVDPIMDCAPSADPSDGKPPDPSFHSFPSKRHTPGRGEQQEQKRKKIRKDINTSTPTSQASDPNNEISSSFNRDSISNFLLGNLFKYL